MSDLLPGFVAAFVPLHIAEYKLKGGPSEDDFARCPEYARMLGEHGDALLYKIPGQTAQMMNMLLDAIAVLAFLPGGVTVFGVHYEESLA